MKLKILRKNDNAEYEVAQGAVITENYDETLDSATIKVPHLTSKIDIEPLDECVLIDSTYGISKHMCVDTFTVSQVNVGYANVYYNYDITLISQTKMLEGVILPNLKITKVAGETRSLAYYINTYLNEYSPKEKLAWKEASDYSFERKFSLSSSAQAKMEGYECPEMQWNQPTLRQVITDLMMVADCIPVLNNGEISAFDLSKTGNSLDPTKINYVAESQSLDDYVSEIRMDLQNCIGEDVTITETIPFRNSDVGVLTTDNVRIQTKYPIYELKEAYFCFVVRLVHESDNDWLYYQTSLDLSSYGVLTEYQKHKTKPIYYHEFGKTGDWHSIESSKKYQNLGLYYTRGSDTIEGWNELVEVDTTGTTLSVREMLIRNIMKIHADAGDTVTYTEKRSETGEKKTWKIDSQFETMMRADYGYMTITYATTADALASIGRAKKTSNDRIIVDNQTNSYVDPNRQGLLEFMKANRLGNLTKLINARYGRYDKQGSLADTYGDSVVFKKETSYHENYCSVNYTATEGYVMRDYYTGVKSKIRSWKILDGSEALERHELMKYYFILSRYDYRVSDGDITPVIRMKEDGWCSKAFKACLPGSFDGYEGGGYCRFGDAVGEYYPKASDVESTYDISGNTFIVHPTIRNVGNGITLTFGAYDNFGFGDLITGSTTGGIGQGPTRYVDSNGENESMYFNISNLTGMNVRFVLPETNNTEIGETQTKNNWQWPILWESQSHFAFVLYRDKDNGEIMKYTLQFEFCTDDSDIVFGSKFIERQYLLNGGSESQTIKFYKSAVKPRQITRDNLPSDKEEINYAHVTESSTVSNRLVIWYEGSAPSGSYIYMTDSNGNVLLAFECKGEDGATDTRQSPTVIRKADFIYCNIASSREDKVYSTSDRSELIGSVQYKNATGEIIS